MRDKNRLPREVVGTSSFETSQTQLDVVLGNLLQLVLLQQRGWMDHVQGPLLTWTVLWACAQSAVLGVRGLN